MRPYAEILRRRGIASLLAAALISRLPLGLNGLAILLYMREVTGSFALAGLAAGAQAFGSAPIRPLQGRLVDRRGTGVLMPIAVAHALALLSLLALGQAGASAALLIGAALACGIAMPPISPVLRSRWPQLVGDKRELMTAAFALDTMFLQAAFVSGPLVAAAVVTVAPPQVALLVSAACVVAGTAWFVAALRSCLGAQLPVPTRSGASTGGRAWLSPGLRTLTAASLPIGFCMGCIEVAIPAFCASQGTASSAGALLACWTAASVLGGLIYGAAASERSVVHVHTRMGVLLPLVTLPMIAADSALTMAALAMLAGLPVAPLLTTRNQLVAAVTPLGTEAEAFSWSLTATITGLSLGIGIAGLVVEQSGWEAAIALAAASAAAGALVATARRATFETASA